MARRGHVKQLARPTSSLSTTLGTPTPSKGRRTLIPLGSGYTCGRSGNGWMLPGAIGNGETWEPSRTFQQLPIWSTAC